MPGINLEAGNSMNITRREIEKQFDRVVANGWLPWFQREAKRANTTTAHLLGIGSRETNLKNIRGDFRGGKYHGFGVMQVDIGTDPEYARTWTPEKVEPSIVRGVDIYLSKVKDTKYGSGKKLAVRGRWFTGRAAEPDDIRRIATAAYNCGRWAYWHFTRMENVDSTTTGDDYSRDVYDRAVQFADILEERGYETMAVHRELELQGKYARREDIKQYGFEPVAERLKLVKGQPQEAAEELEATTYGRELDDIQAAAAEPEPETPTVNSPNGEITPNNTENAAGTQADPNAIPQTPQPAFKPEEKVIAPPDKEGATAKATTWTIGGFVVPGFIVTGISTVKQAISDGYVSADQVGNTVLNFITQNQKYVFILGGCLIGFLALKKLLKQITFWIEMYIAARPDWHDVKVKR